MLVPKDKVFVLPDSVCWDQGILVEPLAVAVHAVRRIPHIAGQNVLVLGAGTIGLMTVLVLKAYGAGTIAVTDFKDDRLNLAKKLGADYVVNPAEENHEEALRSRVGAIDLTFECVGVEATINQGITLTRKGGSVVVAGVYEDDVRVDMGLVQDKEVKLLGTLMYDKEDYTEAIRLVERVPEVTDLITNRFRLEEVANAFEAIISGQTDTIKVLIEVKEN